MNKAKEKENKEQDPTTGLEFQLAQAYSANPNTAKTNQNQAAQFQAPGVAQGVNLAQAAPAYPFQGYQQPAAAYHQQQPQPVYYNNPYTVPVHQQAHYQYNQQQQPQYQQERLYEFSFFFCCCTENVTPQHHIVKSAQYQICFEVVLIIINLLLMGGVTGIIFKDQNSEDHKATEDGEILYNFISIVLSGVSILFNWKARTAAQSMEIPVRLEGWYRAANTLALINTVGATIVFFLAAAVSVFYALFINLILTMFGASDELKSYFFMVFVVFRDSWPSNHVF